MNSKQKKQLEEWIGLKCDDIVFNSKFDNWSQDTSVFNDRIVGKKQVVFLIEDENSELFGYYYNTEVVEKYYWQETDSKSFEFNLQSKNNRLKQPMKFEIKNLQEGGIYLREKSDDRLIWLGNICLRKENDKNYSFCQQNENYFDYNGIKKALCGEKYFTPKRILVIQMK